MMILVHLRLVFIESNYRLRLFANLLGDVLMTADTDSSNNLSLELMSSFSVSRRNHAAVSVKAVPL